MRMNTFLFVVGLWLYGCAGKHNPEFTDSISGTYVRETAFSVTNPETGAEIGMRTIRDSICVKPVGEQFEVSNHKWFKNDYDADGWRNMIHSDNRPVTTYSSKYDVESRTVAGNSGPVLHFEREGEVVYWTVDVKYQKVNR